MRAARVVLLSALLAPACREHGGGAASAPAEPGPAATGPAAPGPAAPDDGGFGDLVAAPGSALVVQHCVRCHGPRQFLQQRGSRDTWRGLIRWMQRDHGMPQLEESTEDRIVDYLATHYAPTESGRRRALPPDLMPPNPYAPPPQNAEPGAGGR